VPQKGTYFKATIQLPVDHSTFNYCQLLTTPCLPNIPLGNHITDHQRHRWGHVSCQPNAKQIISTSVRFLYCIHGVPI